MTVAFDAASSQQVASGNLSWTHTPVGTPAAVIVMLSCELQFSAVTFSAVTYGGVSMTAVSGASIAGNDGGKAQFWELLSGVPSGAQTVAATTSGTTEFFGTACTLTAGAAVQQVSVVASAYVLANSVSATLALDGRDSWVCAALYCGRSAPNSSISAPTSTTTSVYQYGPSHGRQTRINSLQTGSITVTATGDQSEDLQFIAAGWAEAAGGGGFKAAWARQRSQIIGAR